MSEKPFGYLCWYRTSRGGVTYKKMVAVLRDIAVSNSNKQERESYAYNLLSENPLTERQWDLTLEDLFLIFPAPALPTNGK